MTTARGALRPRVAALLTGLAILATGCGDSDPNPDARAAGTSTPAPATGASPGASASVDEASGAELRRFQGQKLRWRPCGEGFACTTVTVPLDHGEPTGRTLELAVTRLRASGQRLGTLLVNPGGPGASGVEYLQLAYRGITAPVRDRYDLVSFDPRGVGASEPIKCLNDRQLDSMIEADVTMDDEADIATWDKLSREFALACQRRAGDLLPHIGTDAVARDLDILRAVFGDAKLNYLGFSYGTYIGARYAELFPARVGHLVLDGAVDPALSARELSLAQAAGFERAWESFAADCLRLSSCELGESRRQIERRLTAMFDAAERSPLLTPSGRRVPEAVAVLGVVSALYSERAWPLLRSSLVAAYDGNGAGLLRLADLYLGREEDGGYSDNSNEAIYAVNCLDRPFAETPDQIRQSVDEFRDVSPLFGELIAWGSLPCTYWPVAAAEPPGPVTALGAAAILVIGTTRDPATPYEWAQRLAAQLSSGVFISYDGDGHTVYGEGVACIDRIVEDYLLNDEVPRDGIQC